MRRLLSCLCLLVVVVGSAAADVASSYNQGVDAWRRKDYAEASRQWSAAVLQGNVDAINNLAFLYYNGLGGPKRVDQAVALWRTAAQAGHSESQWHLGSAYEQGVGVRKSAIHAFAWYRCAAETASRLASAENADSEQAILDDAKASLAKLSPTLNASDRRRAEAMAIDLASRFARAVP